MLTADWEPYELRFIFEARTSRERMWTKKTYFVHLRDAESGIEGIGECGLFAGLSDDDVPGYENLLDYYCRHPREALECGYSSIRMGFETAFRSLSATDGCLFPGSRRWVDGHEGILINGLVWMGDKRTMLNRVKEKLDAGFSVLKLKIGGIDFEDECDIISSIRREFGPEKLTIRLDANGSFSPENALMRLGALARFGIHSLEQPVKAGQWETMRRICRDSEIPIALDEELIGCRTAEESAMLLDAVCPRYVVLKPTLCGGFSGADTWIALAEERGLGWWATSALESNVGLNAIAQWVAAKAPVLPQGLGTGQLYSNNVAPELSLRGEYLYCK